MQSTRKIFEAAFTAASTSAKDEFSFTSHNESSLQAVAFAQGDAFILMGVLENMGVSASVEQHRGAWVITVNEPKRQTADLPFVRIKYDELANGITVSTVFIRMNSRYETVALLDDGETLTERHTLSGFMALRTHNELVETFSMPVISAIAKAEVQADPLGAKLSVSELSTLALIETLA